MTTAELLKAASPRPWGESPHVHNMGKMIVANDCRDEIAFVYGASEANAPEGRVSAQATFDLIVRAVNSFEAMREALTDICDGACWSLGGPRKHIAEIQSSKIEAARAALALADKEGV